MPNDLSTPEKLLELLQTSHFSDVGICFDAGHAHVMTNVADAFTGASQGIGRACAVELARAGASGYCSFCRRIERTGETQAGAQDRDRKVIRR